MTVSKKYHYNITLYYSVDKSGASPFIIKIDKRELKQMLHIYNNY